MNFLLKKNNLFERFETIVSAENVQRAKPDPEIFLLANQKLGTAKKRNIDFRRFTKWYFLAASAAEIPVVMVPDLLPTISRIDQKQLGLFALHEIPALLK